MKTFYSFEHIIKSNNLVIIAIQPPNKTKYKGNDLF